MTGLLSGLDELLAKHKSLPPAPDETPAERQAAQAKLDAAIDAAVQKDWDHEVGEIERAVLERKYVTSLEEIYAEQIAALHRKTDAVRREYAGLFAKCRAMCRECGITDFPTPPIAIAAWLHELAQDGAPYHKLKKASAAASYFHRINAYPDPTEDGLCRAILRAHCKKAQAKPKKRKLNGNGQSH
jgi:hypothetical protein